MGIGEPLGSYGTTCSISHILSHLRGHISSDPQPNYSTDTFNCHQMLHSGGTRKPQRAGLLPWPLSLSRFPVMERDKKSFLIGCCTILDNRYKASTHSNHRHCCYATAQLEYAHLGILADPTCWIGKNVSLSAVAAGNACIHSFIHLHIRYTTTNTICSLTWSVKIWVKTSFQVINCIYDWEIIWYCFFAVCLFCNWDQKVFLLFTLLFVAYFLHSVLSTEWLVSPVPLRNSGSDSRERETYREWRNETSPALIITYTGFIFHLTYNQTCIP